MWKSISVYAILLIALLSFGILSSYTGEHTTEQKEDTPTTSSSANSLPQIVKAISLSKSFDFAGEKVPTEIFDVKERLDRELLKNAYYHSSTVLNLKRAKRYFPMIEKILAENNVPDDFKYLAVAESDLSNAVSPAGAKGIWQFMKGTAREYGLRVTSEVDERYHFEKATRAACKYLLKAKSRFGNWTMAAASYNVGGTKLRKETNAQREENYYNLNLNSETARYVFRIIALKEILNNPRDYGFYVDDFDKYPPLNNYKEIEVKSSIPNLGDFAKKHNISYRMLKVYNPWLTSTSLSNKEKKTYYIRIPK